MRNVLNKYSFGALATATLVGLGAYGASAQQQLPPPPFMQQNQPNAQTGMGGMGGMGGMNMQMRHDGMRMGWRGEGPRGPMARMSPEDRQALYERVRDSGAKIVTVAMGSPRQEILMRDCRLVSPDALYMGVGGTYDVFTGHVKRAPKVWQNLGLEWLYRLLSQPTRITRQIRLLRYLAWHYTGKM